MIAQPDNIQRYKTSAVLNNTLLLSSVNYKDTEKDLAVITLLQNGMILAVIKLMLSCWVVNPVGWFGNIYQDCYRN